VVKGHQGIPVAEEKKDAPHHPAPLAAAADGIKFLQQI